MISHLLVRKPAVIIIAFLLLGLPVFLAGCKGAGSDPTRDITITNVQVSISTPTPAYAFKTSDPGYITLRGSLIVLDPISMIPSKDDGVYLVPMPADQAITGIPQFEIGKVPQAEVDELSGEFAFTNISPGQYAVVVLTAGGSQIPVRYSENGNYAIVTLEDSQKDSTVDLGHVTLP